MDIECSHCIQASGLPGYRSNQTGVLVSLAMTLQNTLPETNHFAPENKYIDLRKNGVFLFWCRA